MNLYLFGEPEPAIAHVETPVCAHPADSQILNRNLFSGAYDVVCAQCGATVAESYQQ